MLVPFVIDADSLAPDPDWSPATLESCHDDTLDLWRRFGLLLHDGDSWEQSRLKEAVEKLPQKQRNLWQDMLKHFPSIRCSGDWNGSVGAQTASALCSNAALALVNDFCAELEFEIPQDERETIRRCSNGEQLVICRLQLGRHCSVVKSAHALATKDIEPGDTYKSIWDGRFHTLASATSGLKYVSIVDRYAIEQHFKCPRTYLSGLNRFLKLLNQESGLPTYLKVYSCLTKKWKEEVGVSIEDVSREVHHILDRLPRGGIKRLDVYMVPNDVFRREAHRRHVRFARDGFSGFVWQLDIGLRVFEGPVARERCGATFVLSDGTHRRVEEELKNHKGTVKIKIR